MSDRPQACPPQSLVAEESVRDQDTLAWAAHRPAQRRERGPRALGAQTGQWRWRSGRELWPHRK